MRLFFKIAVFICFFVSAADHLQAQLTVSGTVYDSSKKNYVEQVRVESTGGKYTVTDSMGRYRIPVTENDSLTFIYQNKPTQKFAVHGMNDLRQFDISLGVRVKDGYRVMKEVVIFARSYRQDSLENRELYGDIYNYRKPTIRTSVSPSGAVGADVNEIINMFRFKRNKRLAAFQTRLEQQEQDQFVRYRFNKNFVRRITHLEGNELDTFMVKYLPTYKFASTADVVSFNKYILNSSYAFKIDLLRQEAAAATKEN